MEKILFVITVLIIPMLLMAWIVRHDVLDFAKLKSSGVTVESLTHPRFSGGRYSVNVTLSSGITGIYSSGGGSQNVSFVGKLPLSEKDMIDTYVRLIKRIGQQSDKGIEHLLWFNGELKWNVKLSKWEIE